MLYVENKKLKAQLAESRKYHAEAVCKECKCESNTEVNQDAIKQNLELKAENKKLRADNEEMRNAISILHKEKLAKGE